MANTTTNLNRKFHSWSANKSSCFFLVSGTRTMIILAQYKVGGMILFFPKYQYHSFINVPSKAGMT